MLLQTLEQIASYFGPLESFDLRPPEHTEDARGDSQMLNIVYFPV